MPTKHFVVKGRVQGVFFRASARQEAEKLFLTGWVKNTAGGHVEAIASGSEKSLENFTAWCRQGPPAASVLEVIITDLPDQPFPDFAIRT